MSTARDMGAVPDGIAGNLQPISERMRAGQSTQCSTSRMMDQRGFFVSVPLPRIHLS